VLLEVLRAAKSHINHMPRTAREDIGNALCGIKWRTQQKRGAPKGTPIGFEADAAVKDRIGECLGVSFLRTHSLSSRITCQT
jgi:hypothetical protein